MTLLAPIRAGSLRQQVAQVIREAIFSGELRPGDELRELTLARKMDVSQATIREALAVLEQVGLVVKVPKRGTTVTNLTPAEVRERLAVRLTLEQMAGVEASRRMDAATFAELERLSAKITAGIERKLYSEVAQADLAFHQRIWDCSGNATVEHILVQVTTPLFAFIGLLHKLRSVDQRKTHPHGNLIAALATKRESVIREAFRLHIEGSYGPLLDSGADNLLSLVGNQ